MRRLDVGKGPKARQHLQQGYNLLFIYFLLFALWFNGHKKRGKSECGVHKNEKTKRNHNARCEFQCTHTLKQIYTHTTSTPCVYTISKVSNSHVFHPSSMCWSPLIFFYQFIPHLCWTVPLSQCPTARRLGGFNYLQLKHGALLIVCAAAQRHKVCNAFWFILRTHVSAMHSHTHPHTQTHTCINWNEVPATFVHISEILIFIYRPCGCDIRRGQQQLLCLCVW